MITLIAAMAHQRVIGFNGDMPWHMPADLKHFKAWTTGKTIVMGRKTFDSLGKPLPNRRNIVVSRNESPIDGCELCHDLPKLLADQPADQELMVVGGATIYEQAMPFADRMVLTFIDANVEGDTHFPAWPADQWMIVDRDEHRADDKNPHDYQFVVFEKA